MINKINAAIIGMGIGEKHLEAINSYKNATVLMVYEKNMKRRKLLEKKYPKIIFTKNEQAIYENNKINLITIASFDEYHFSQVMKAFKFKKNILVEKPICLDKKEFKKIEKKFLSSKLYIYCNFVLQTETVFKNIKKKFIKNDNNIYYLESDYLWSRRHKLHGWRSKTKKYNLILGAAVHIINLIVFLHKNLPKYVTVFSNKIATKSTNFKKNSFNLIVLEYSNGMIIKISANPYSLKEHFHNLIIYSKNYTLIHSEEVSRFIKISKNKKIKTSIKDKYPDKKNRKELIHNFIDNIINKKNRLKYFFELKKTMSICFAAMESEKKERKVKITY